MQQVLNLGILERHLDLELRILCLPVIIDALLGDLGSVI